MIAWDTLFPLRKSGKNILIGRGPDYMEVSPKGEVFYRGEGALWDDINIPLSSLSTGSSSPDVGLVLGSSNILGYLFAGGTSGPSDEVHAPGAEYLHGFAINSDIIFHVHSMNESAIGVSNKGVSFFYEIAFIVTGKLISEFIEIGRAHV